MEKLKREMLEKKEQELLEREKQMKQMNEQYALQNQKLMEAQQQQLEAQKKMIEMQKEVEKEKNKPRPDKVDVSVKQPKEEHLKIDQQNNLTGGSVEEDVRIKLPQSEPSSTQSP